MYLVYIFLCYLIYDITIVCGVAYTKLTEFYLIELNRRQILTSIDGSKIQFQVDYNLNYSIYRFKG